METEPVDTTELDALLGVAGRTLAGVSSAAEELASDVAARGAAAAGASRGHFRPDEEEILLGWFARFLGVRGALWDLLAEVSQPLAGRLDGIRDRRELAAFACAYVAACLVVRLDRLLLEEIATDPVVQRKLNEGDERTRVPRKQYTAVFESFTDPGKAMLMERAMRFVRRRRDELAGLATDPDVGPWIADLGELERCLDPSRRRYLTRLAAFLVHAVRRGGASARQQTFFAALEASGRLVAELRDRWRPPLLDERRRAELAALLRPGDVIVTRHERALSNLFLPGFWPHAALYVGSEEDRRRLGVAVDEERAARWCEPRRVLEALKDGVRFRPLAETLAVDAAAVVRPRLEEPDLALALARAVRHEGKLYNFDFDFFRADRLVCTEVVYRAFDGVGGLGLELRERAGRPTLSAEDLLDLALEGDLFQPVALALGSAQMVSGAATGSALAATYRKGLPPA